MRKFLPCAKTNVYLKFNLHAEHFLANGHDGVETGGVVQGDENVVWKKLHDGSKYLMTSDLTILSGANVLAGSYFQLTQGVTIEVTENGFFNVSGAAGNKITFTSKTPAQNQYWTGNNHLHSVGNNG